MFCSVLVSLCFVVLASPCFAHSIGRSLDRGPNRVCVNPHARRAKNQHTVSHTIRHALPMKSTDLGDANHAAIKIDELVVLLLSQVAMITDEVNASLRVCIAS